MKEIRITREIGYGDKAFGRGEIVKIGSDGVDAKTAGAWVRSGLAISTEPAEGPNLTAAPSKVVVHERGGQELLQAATTVTAGGKREGPAPENPTDSDPAEDAEDGAARTAAGAVIAENADPEQAPEPKSTKKSSRKGAK